MSDTIINLPDWYDEANASDATLVRSFSNVGDFEVEFHYEPGDRSANIADGFTGLTFSLMSGLLDVHISFSYEQDPNDITSFNLPGWRLTGCVVQTLKVTLPIDAEENQWASLKSFPPLLKVAEEKWAAVEESERRVAEGEQAMYDQHVEEEREEHLAGKHNDGYDHPDCPLCR